MTITYDPTDARYTDEADVRDELTRVFDVCRGCRRCVDLCTSFPTLFELVDRFDDHDPGRLTPAEQDRVADGCFQCKLCSVECPYVPGAHDLAIDFPRLMLRTDAMRHANGHVPVRRRATTQVLARTDLLGKVATAPLLQRAARAPAGSLTRTIIAKVAGVSAVRLLPPYAKQRFTTWFAQRPEVESSAPRGRVVVFPTCLVEYQETGIGKDLVRVYERNGIACTVSDAGCCGAPWLHSGDVARFRRVAARNVATLAREVRRGAEIVVPQPTCGYLLTNDYVDHVGGPDAALVAAHTFDATGYLVDRHRDQGTALDTDFRGEVPDAVTYHVACHLRAEDRSPAGRDLLELTGAEVTSVMRCSSMDAMWGLRAEHDEISIPMAERLADEIEDAGNATVAGDCHLANRAIVERTGRPVAHPLQILARAYGIPDDG